MAKITKVYQTKIYVSPLRLFDLIIGDKTYAEWTSIFSAGSHYTGDWSVGNQIQFLAPNEEGVLSGLVSIIEENVPGVKLTIKHIGQVKDGEVDTESEEVKSWAPSYEKYSIGVDGASSIWNVVIESEDIWADYFDEHWPLALEKFKSMAEAANITISAIIDAPLEHTWKCWTEPTHIMQWNHASEDWHCPAATNDLNIGGKFCYTMAPVDNSFSFNFEGHYEDVKLNKAINTYLGDGRRMKVSFEKIDKNTTKITEWFEIEFMHAVELQEQGWLAILNNFKAHAESAL